MNLLGAFQAASITLILKVTAAAHAYFRPITCGQIMPPGCIDKSELPS
jgi:hypothetical protein